VSASQQLGLWLDFSSPGQGRRATINSKPKSGWCQRAGYSGAGRLRLWARSPLPYLAAPRPTRLRLERAALASDLRLLQAVQAELDALDQQLAALAYPIPEVKLLMTLPGVDYPTALALVAAWGTVERFNSPAQAASYLGLSPSTCQSDQHCYHGPITKRGNPHTGWMLIQAAQQADRHPGPLGVFFRRLAHKKGRNVAVVATARKLATIGWHMLQNN
jgi:transposase